MDRYKCMVDRAYEIAREAHAGQKDIAGADYIGHPIRVAEKFRHDPEARMVAVLHDTIEDTFVTPEFLFDEGFGDNIVSSILSITRGEDESYEDFILRCSGNDIGRRVKIADLEDNMDIRRLPKLTDGHVKRLRKYLKAWQYLKKIEEIKEKEKHDEEQRRQTDS